MAFAKFELLMISQMGIDNTSRDLIEYEYNKYNNDIQTFTFYIFKFYFNHSL
jgi:hypothetical protein